MGNYHVPVLRRESGSNARDLSGNLENMNTILIAYLIMLGFSNQIQLTEKWTSFIDKNSNLVGSKDTKGKVCIGPKFTGFTTASQFDNIIAVTEEKNGKYESYYLTKSGKKVGQNSLHIHDNGADCESEGFIRFRDNVTDKVGMFGKNGNIVIPADYNELSKVQNGLVWALKGAKKEFWDKHKESGCNHYSWKGGQQLLINTNNDVLAKNFKYEDTLNFFSIEIKEEKDNKPSREFFRGTNSKIYSFVNYKKEFDNWLQGELLNHLTIEKLSLASNERITFWRDPNGWTSENKAVFLGTNYELIKNRLLTLKQNNTDFFVSVDGLNRFIFNNHKFDIYFNNCGDPLIERYPVMSLIINSKNESDFSQDHFDFLRTDKGYKLISVTIGKGVIK